MKRSKRRISSPRLKQDTDLLDLKIESPIKEKNLESEIETDNIRVIGNPFPSDQREESRVRDWNILSRWAVNGWLWRSKRRISSPRLKLTCMRGGRCRFLRSKRRISSPRLKHDKMGVIKYDSERSKRRISSPRLKQRGEWRVES